MLPGRVSTWVRVRIRVWVRVRVRARVRIRVRVRVRVRVRDRVKARAAACAARGGSAARTGRWDATTMTTAAYIRPITTHSPTLTYHPLPYPPTAHPA